MRRARGDEAEGRPDGLRRARNGDGRVTQSRREMFGDPDRRRRGEVKPVDVVLGAHAAERLMQGHARIKAMALPKLAVAGHRASRRRGDARRRVRSRFKAEQEERKAFLAAKLRDLAQRVLEQVRAQPAGVEQNRVIERIFENDELRRRLLALPEPQEPHQSIERADGPQKAVRDPMFRGDGLELRGPTVMQARVGAAEKQNIHLTLHRGAAPAALDAT